MMPALRFATAFLILICCSGSLTGQDKLFTQAFAHPVDLNPAFAGAIEGRYRVTVAYRDQWRSFVESPFRTIGVYGDVKIIPQRRSDDFIGAGLSVIGDRNDIYNVNQNSISLYGSYHKALNADQRTYISGGFSAGIAQRNINYESIYFNDQFNGLDNFSLGTSETLPVNNFAFIDLGLGVSFTTGLSKYSWLSAGLAADHLQGNSISFYQRSIEDVNDEWPDVKMYRKVTGYISAEIASSQYLSFLPRLLYQKEGPHTMMAAAALVKFDINNYNDQALHLGGGVRMNQANGTGFQPPAAYLMAAFELEGLLIGLSHDITLSKLGATSPGRGAFELSISFTGFYENADSMCPTF